MRCEKPGCSRSVLSTPASSETANIQAHAAHVEVLQDQPFAALGATDHADHVGQELVVVVGALDQEVATFEPCERVGARHDVLHEPVLGVDVPGADQRVEALQAGSRSVIHLGPSRRPEMIARAGSRSALAAAVGCDEGDGPDDVVVEPRPGAQPGSRARRCRPRRPAVADTARGGRRRRRSAARGRRTRTPGPLGARRLWALDQRVLPRRDHPASSALDDHVQRDHRVLFVHRAVRIDRPRGLVRERHVRPHEGDVAQFVASTFVPERPGEAATVRLEQRVATAHERAEPWELR